MTVWALLDEHGNMIQQVMSDKNPKEAYDWPVERVVKMPTLGDMATQSFNGKKMVDDITKIERLLLFQIDGLRRIALKEWEGEGLSLIYQRKGQEAMRWLADAGQGFGPEAFPWLWAEAQEAGETLAAVARRVVLAMDASEARLRSYEARAINAKRLVREATTAKAKKAVVENFLTNPI